jgi:hypothetical protein
MGSSCFVYFETFTIGSVPPRATAQKLASLHHAGVLAQGEKVVPSPECICSKIGQPVCGVDNQTYGNPCELQCAGVEKKSDGECPPGGDTKCCPPEMPVCRCGGCRTEEVASMLKCPDRLGETCCGPDVCADVRFICDLSRIQNVCSQFFAAWTLNCTSPGRTLFHDSCNANHLKILQLCSTPTLSVSCACMLQQL